MTTPPPDPGVPDIDADESAVHAVLDGEATPEQRRVVARDPELRARLEELRGVAAALAAMPDEPLTSTFDELRARALDTLDRDAGEDPVDADAASESRPDDEDAGEDHLHDEPVRVVPIAPRRRRRRLPPLPAVAAVVLVLLAVGLGLILTDRGSGDQRADKAGVAAGGESSDDAAAGDHSRGAPTEASQGGAPAADTGNAASFADATTLRTALQTVDVRTLSTLAANDQSSRSSGSEELEFAEEDTKTNEVQRCSSVLEASDADIQPVQAAAVVVVDGERLLVLSNPVKASKDNAASTRLTVVEPVGCVPRFAVAR